MTKLNININKVVGEEKYEPNNLDIAEQMTEEVKSFCDLLFTDSNKFNKEQAFNKVLHYIDRYERILYAPISNAIYACYTEHETEETEKMIGNLITNMQAIVDYTRSDKYKNRREESNKKQRIFDDARKAIIKIWDHINLAQMQYSTLKETDKEYMKKFNKRIQPIKDRMTKELNAQLLTMVSIFTALAFLIFGGISSLENILSHPKLPLFKIMIVGCVWGVCILNLVFVFLFCVGKMTKLNFKSTEIKEASIFQKYPIVWFSNFVIISVMAFSIWGYYLTQEGIHTWLDKVCSEYPKCASAIGTVIILIIIIGIGGLLMKKIRYTDGNEE